MNKSWAILAAVALFASGLAIGALGLHLFYSQRIVGTHGGPMPMGPMFERWLTHRLDLDSEQRQRVDEILRESRVEVDQLRNEMGPRLRTLNRRTAEAISEVLTPEQREQLEEFMARRQRGFGRGEGRAGRQRRRPPPV